MESGRGDALEQQSPLVDLVARIAADDRDAERRFVERFQAGMRALARRHCRPGEAMVDDIVQEVMHHVLVHLREGRIQDPDALPAYIRNAVVFAVQAEYRKRSRRGETAGEDVLVTLPSDDDPEAKMASAQLSARVRGLMAELPVARDREVLRRFYVEEETKDQVCDALAIDPGHFHRVVFRARARLRELLAFAGIGEAG